MTNRVVNIKPKANKTIEIAYHTEELKIAFCDLLVDLLIDLKLIQYISSISC